MSGLTGLPDTDILILLQLNDQELTRVCRSSRYLNQLCQNDFFWGTRVQQRFPQWMHHRNRFSSYRELYQTFVRKAYVLQIGKISLTIYNDIRVAYQELLLGLSRIARIMIDVPIERASALSNLFPDRRFMIRLYTLSVNEEIPVDDPQHSLINLNTPQIIVHPDLASMPTVIPETLIVYSLSSPSVIGVARPSTEIMERLLQAIQEGRLPERGLTLQRSDTRSIMEFYYFGGEDFLYLGQGEIGSITHLIISRVNGQFMVALIPPNPNFRYAFRSYAQGRRIAHINYESLLALLPQIRAQLPWEPIENIGKYLQ